MPIYGTSLFHIDLVYMTDAAPSRCPILIPDLEAAEYNSFHSVSHLYRILYKIWINFYLLFTSAGWYLVCRRYVVIFRLIGVLLVLKFLGFIEGFLPSVFVIIGAIFFRKVTWPLLRKRPALPLVELAGDVIISHLGRLGCESCDVTFATFRLRKVPNTNWFRHISLLGRLGCEKWRKVAKSRRFRTL